MSEINNRKNLVGYFKKNLSKGYSSDTLKFALLSQGYSKTVVVRALEVAHQELSQKAPMLKEKPRIRYEVYDQHNNIVEIKKPWWKRIFN